MNINEINSYLLQLGELLEKDSVDYEVTIVGGAAIILNHKFRKTTPDIDIIGNQPSFFTKVINCVAKNNNIANEWMNYNAMKTSSYSKGLENKSSVYKVFNNRLVVKVVPDDIIITMKLKAFREFRHDRSDILGIVNENPNITYQKIYENCITLYGNERAIPRKSWQFLDDVLLNKVNYDDLIRDELYEYQKSVDCSREFFSIMNYRDYQRKRRKSKNNN